MMLPTNIWPVYQWRRAVQWVLRQKVYRGWSRGMLKEKRNLVGGTMPPDNKRLSPGERRRLDHLNFWTGNGSATYFKPLSPAEYLRRKKWVRQTIKEVMADALAREAQDRQGVDRAH